MTSKRVSHMLSNQATLLSTRLSTRSTRCEMMTKTPWLDWSRAVHSVLYEKMSIQVKERASASGAVKVTAKKHRWYLGGFASAMAACCTHPLDLLKVRVHNWDNCKAWKFHLHLLSTVFWCIELTLVWLKVWINRKRKNIAFIVRFFISS